jgi:hypothetical protein
MQITVGLGRETRNNAFMLTVGQILIDDITDKVGAQLHGGMTHMKVTPQISFQY